MDNLVHDQWVIGGFIIQISERNYKTQVYRCKLTWNDNASVIKRPNFKPFCPSQPSLGSWVKSEAGQKLSTHFNISLVWHLTVHLLSPDSHDHTLPIYTTGRFLAQTVLHVGNGAALVTVTSTPAHVCGPNKDTAIPQSLCAFRAMGHQPYWMCIIYRTGKTERVCYVLKWDTIS